jgi:hypothetical protein
VGRRLRPALPTMSQRHFVEGPCYGAGFKIKVSLMGHASQTLGGVGLSQAGALSRVKFAF